MCRSKQEDAQESEKTEMPKNGSDERSVACKGDDGKARPPIPISTTRRRANEKVSLQIFIDKAVAEAGSESPFASGDAALKSPHQSPLKSPMRSPHKSPTSPFHNALLPISEESSHYLHSMEDDEDEESERGEDPGTNSGGSRQEECQPREGDDRSLDCYSTCTSGPLHIIKSWFSPS